MNILDDQKKKVEDEIYKLEKMGGTLTGKAKKIRDSAFTKFPIVFVLLSTFGLVSTFYGFEKVIDEISFFAENPRMILLAGILTLTFTGSLYKKLT